MWEQCREIIRGNVSPEQYNALFAYTEFSSYADGQLVLSVPSRVFTLIRTGGRSEGRASIPLKTPSR